MRNTLLFVSLSLKKLFHWADKVQFAPQLLPPKNDSFAKHNKTDCYTVKPGQAYSHYSINEYIIIRKLNP